MPDNKKILILVISIFLIGLSFTGMARGDTTQTFVILVHGYSITGTEGSDQWQMGVNIYQQLVDSGYIVGVVQYYGEFQVSYSNGYVFSDPNFYGTSNTPIENIAQELAYSIENLANTYGNVNLDIIAHSMGGLVTAYMLENYVLPVNLENVIYIASPFNGSPFANIASYLGLDIMVGYQVDEMLSGSSFLSNLQNNYQNIINNYGSTTFIVYQGTYDPWWGYLFFNSDNDGVVSINSATSTYYDYLYTFPNDVHTQWLDQFTAYGISYFEDQSVANQIIYNLGGNY
ncbi:MAG: esterase/lipase family protein [Thermoplasmata archaeon]|nr:alpha/beta hydrolase [Thermoplasmata archaeon]